MSDSKAAIQNANEIIERFGGIRPMANKTGVAVTTIQGWKKRDAIPASRRTLLLNTAQEHHVDLSDIIGGVAAEQQTAKPLDNDPLKAALIKKQQPAASKDEAWRSELANMEKRVLKKSIMVNAGLLGLIAGAVAVLLLPSAEQAPKPLDEARLGVIENDLSQLQIDMGDVKEEQGLLGKLVPKDLDQKIAALQEKAVEATDNVDAAIAQKLAETQEKAQKFVIENENWSARLAALEEQMAGLDGSPILAGVLARYQSLTESEGGQALLAQSTSDLASALSATKDNADISIEEALQAARVESDALGQSFANVPSQDLRAAALLLAMSKFRGSLHRGNESFADDYQVLRSLMGEDNVELNAALDRLAPHAQSGVLTPEGLGVELRSLTGDIVMASLRGEDVSVKEKAAARFNEVLQIEKDGELITGTETQATVLKAENLLDSGDLAGAIAQMQNLDGDAAQIAQPWISKAEATLLAGKMENFIGQAMNVQVFGSASGLPGVVVKGVGGGELIQHPEYGVNILKPNKSVVPKLP